MSLFDLFRGKSRDRPEPPNVPVERDLAGDRIYYEDLVGGILDELERRRDERASYELKWTLNANFKAGHQNCDINPHKRIIEDIVCPTVGDKSFRVYNRIAPLMETRAANLGSINYDMSVNARSPEPDDWEKAKISTKLLRYCQSVTDFDKKMDKLLAWCELCGTAFTLSWWDDTIGEIVGYGVTETVLDDGTVTVEETPVHLGDLAFGLISPYEVFPQSLTIEEITDQHDIIIERVLDIGEIYDLYGRRFDGDSIDSYVLTPIPNGSTGHGISNTTFGLTKEKRDNVERVVTYLENPSRDHPEGRIITIIRDEIVYMGSLPAGVFPVVAAKAKPVEGQFFGKSVIEDLIPLQRSYNENYNKIQDFIDTVANNPWLVPEGSLEDVEETGIQSGDILVYRRQLGKPEIITYPDPPAIVQQQLDRLSADMEYAAGVSQLMVYGSAPTGVTSGTAIDNLRQIDSTRMSLTGDSIRNAVLSMAQIWLRLNKAFGTGYRALMISGESDIGGVYTWCSDDINSFDVVYDAENELRHGKDQQRNDFVTAYNMGLLSPNNPNIDREYLERGRELFDIAGATGEYSLAELQRQNAKREVSYLTSGVLPEEGKYDDDEIHLEEHLKFALSEDYRQLQKKAPQYIAMFDEHIERHRAKIRQKQAEAQVQAMQQAAMSNTQKG